jgi:ketosteroid isomerase-like protein
LAHILEPSEFRELDHERVLVLVRYHGRGKVSGVDLGQVGRQGAQVWSVRDGKVTRFVRYMDTDRALAHLGLASGADSPEP